MVSIDRTTTLAAPRLWAVVDVAEVCRPRLLAVENVPEFEHWPLFPLWRQALERLGYAISVQVLDASEFEVAQQRKRIYIAGVLGGCARQLRSPCLAPVPALGLIDWTLTGGPIAKPGRSKATLARVAAGRARFGKRFLAPYTTGAGPG